MFYKDQRLTIEGPCTLIIPKWVIDDTLFRFDSIQNDDAAMVLADQQDRELFGRRYTCLTMMRPCELVTTFLQLPSVH